MTPRWLFYLVTGRKPPRTPRRVRLFYRGPARSASYRKYVRSLPCACCGSVNHVEAAHTKTGSDDGGTSQKSSDFGCIPLCSDCHTQAPHAYHRDRQECERRIFLRCGMTVPELVRMLNAEWKAGKEEAA